MKALIIDYGAGNLASVKGAMKRCGKEVLISSNPNDLTKASHVILPGVGAFSVAMSLLEKGGWIDALEKEVIKYQVPLLGICLGMQLLASSSTEGPTNVPLKGLGFISGTVIKLEPQNSNDRVPHIGWSEVKKSRDSLLMNSIPNSSDFYFVHGYHFKPSSQEHIVATTEHCGKICALVNKENIFGTQFHPEKSSRSGLQLLKNFLTTE